MHTLAWMGWVVMVMAVALAATNPLYLGLVLPSVLLVAALSPKTHTGAAGLRAMLLFGGGVLVFSLGVAAINGNAGSHVLFTVPGSVFPGWMGGLRLGGPVTGEGLLYNFNRGLAILAIFVAFGVFNAAVSPVRVLRTAPAALFHAGLVVTIGLTLLPSTIEDLRRVREMQSLRGAASGWRQAPGLVVPAVIGGLERSMRLAEAMEARGYATSEPPGRRTQLIATASAPLFFAATLGWLYLPEWRLGAMACGVLALAAIGAWLRDAAKRRNVTRYAPERLAALDIVCIAGSLGMAVGVLALRTAGWGGLDYNPFAGLPWPPFEPLGAAISLACGWPAVRLFFAPGAAAGAVGQPQASPDAFADWTAP